LVVEMSDQALVRENRAKIGFGAPIIPKPVLFSLLTTVFLDFLGFSIVLPYLYFFAQAMGASLFTYGTIVGAYALMQVICAPVFGKLSDMYGRRTVLIVTLVGSGFSYMLFGLSNVLWLVFAARMLGGAFGSTYSIAQAYVADVTNKETRLKYLGYLAGAYGLGYLVGPMMGGLLSSGYGYAAPALFSCIITLANATVTYLKFPRNNIAKSTLSSLKTPFSLFGGLRFSKEQTLLMLINFISTLVFVSLIVIVPPWMHAVFSFGTLYTGIALSYAGAVSILTVALIAPRLSKKISSSALILVGFATVAVNYLGLGLVSSGSSISLVLVLMMAGFLSFGFSIIGPAVNSLISISSGSMSQGQTLGIAKSAASAAQVIAPSLATACFSLGISIGQAGFGFLVCMAISLFTIPMLTLLRNRNYLGTWEKMIGSGYMKQPAILRKTSVEVNQLD
jgi:DHA1 family tetracycline resistance protein-like MFS transporter